ncbi:Inositol-pentakisphosphate 2-kinase [Apiospora saccharicola]|uniref:Inositol-pentakisphosphate 2-kinase n=1 Tax=Apiospora saccharicola TaxID=335842 RepID=A0ABR1WEA0_9PEZI
MDTQSLWHALSGAYDDDADAGRKEAAVKRATDRLQDAKTFLHVAEGRANAVFRACDADGQDLLPGGLLRVPKKIEGAHPYDYERLQQFRATMIVPAVGPKHLVPQLLVRVTEAQATAMNETRAQSGKAKDASTIKGPGFAMLIQDMTPSPAAGQLGAEFKPKWLAQSPIAPEGAKRCRTCAREAYRNQKALAKANKAKQEQDQDGQESNSKPVATPVCPLGLLHDDPDVVLRSIARFAPSTWTSADHERLRRALATSGLLTKLRDVQTRGDPGNTMFDNPEDPGFGLAMTLRDCTCFVRMPKDDEEGEVEIKLADVDEKNWHSKKEYWQKSHNNLVDSGFYHGTEEPHMETSCVLQM